MNRSDSITHYLEQTSKRINRELETIFRDDMNIPPSLKKSMEYSLHAGGKRIRPILVLAAVEALNGNVDDALPVSCAVELVHTYSLIHDDLPALDNDDLRRGKPTNHKIYGEAMAIMAGDALLTHAFYQIASMKQKNLPADRLLRIVEELSWFAGPRGMVGGQVADLEGEQGITSLAQLEYIHRHKTGDLIVFSLRAGGHLANADEEQLEALEQFGFAIGLAFQIQDDILDRIGNEEKIGKRLHSDEKQEKVTFPYFLGLEECIRAVKEYTNKGKQAILQAEIPNPERLLELADYLMNRDY
mgnify:CR=1 FL=1